MLYHKRYVTAIAGDSMRCNLWPSPVSLPQALLESPSSTKRRSSCTASSSHWRGEVTFCWLYSRLFSYGLFCRGWQSPYPVRAPWGIARCLQEQQSSYSSWLWKLHIFTESSTRWTEAAKIEENSCAKMSMLELHPDTKTKMCPTWRRHERSGVHPWWSAVNELLSTFR